MKINLDKSRRFGKRKGKKFQGNFRADQKTSLEILKAKKDTDENNKQVLESGSITPRTLANLKAKKDCISTEMINRARRDMIYYQNT